MSDALFDSNIVIDMLAGRRQALDELDRYSTVAISVVSWIEVMAGAEPETVEPLRQALSGYRRIDIDQDIAERAARIRRERRITLPDAIVQATAEENDLPLITRNERDFPDGTPGVRIPYRL